MAPTLTASYFVKTSTQSAAALSTPSFTPSNGEVIVVTMETWDTGTSMGSVTGGGQTYTPRVTVAPGGFRPWVGITTAVISGSPGSMTVSATPSASARCSMVVERWSGAQLAASPAVGSGNGGSGSASGTLTTTAAGSVVSWVAGDAQSLDPATRAYLASATDEGVRDDHVGSNGVGYHAWQSAASAGSQTFGLSAPTGMQWDIAGIEVQAAAGGPTPITLTDAGSGADVATVSATVPISESGSASDAPKVNATVPIADTASAGDALTANVTVTLTDAGSASDAVSVNAGSTPVSVSDSGTALDSLTVLVTSALSDAASALDALGVTATIRLADVGVGADDFAGPGGVTHKQLADTGSACDCLCVRLLRPNTGSTTRPSTGTVTRPNTGSTTRPSTGTVTRPNTGITHAPGHCGC